MEHHCNPDTIISFSQREKEPVRSPDEVKRNPGCTCDEYTHLDYRDRRPGQGIAVPPVSASNASHMQADVLETQPGQNKLPLPLGEGWGVCEPGA